MTDSGFVHRFEPAAAAGEPALLLLHGTGGDENDLLPLGRALEPRPALLSPRGRVLEHGMPRFFRRIGEGVFDLADLRARTDELADFVAWAAGRYAFDAARVVAAGYSNGANIAVSLMLQRPETLAGAILMRPMLPYEPEPRPATEPRSVLVLAGRADPLTPRTQVATLERVLRGAGASVAVEWTAGGHELHPEDVAVAREWWRNWRGT